MGVWGYSFSFDSDATTNSKYYIRSVTVSKVVPGVALGTNGAYNTTGSGTNWTVNVTNGSVNFGMDVATGGNTVSVNVSAGATAVINGTQHFSGITLGAGATLKFSAGGSQKVVIAKTLTLGSNAVIDLAGSALVLDYTGLANPATTLEGFVRTGYNAGTWTGKGITSSTAAGNPGLYAVGIIDNAKRGTPLASFGGATVPATAVLIRLTYLSDIDLDGLVTSNDAILFAANYSDGKASTHQFGDLNYSGMLESSDAILFATAYNEALPLITSVVSVQAAPLAPLTTTSAAVIRAAPARAMTPLTPTPLQLKQAALAASLPPMGGPALVTRRAMLKSLFDAP